MAKVITFSTKFPDYHPRAGEPTFFVEKILNSLGYVQFKKDIPIGVRHLVNDFVILDGQQKHHTIRAGNRWKVGDKFSPRIWSGTPRRSKQIIIAPDIEVKKAWDIVINSEPGATYIMVPTEIHSQFQLLPLDEVSKNDGLSICDFESWFNPKQKSVEILAQIICWNENLEY